jgi:hypothetical protein
MAMCLHQHLPHEASIDVFSGELRHKMATPDLAC